MLIMCLRIVCYVYVNWQYRPAANYFNEQLILFMNC